jgi:hypothetical protein
MKIVGIDLAGLEKNDTGFCVLVDKEASVRIMHSDVEIVTAIVAENPDLIAIDAPLTTPKNGDLRKCDLELKQYGVLPPMLGGMAYLTKRGNKLREILSDKYKVIEVFPTGSAKIMGFWSTEPAKRQRALLAMQIRGDTEKRMLTKDEVDSITAALTGLMFSEGKAREVGDDEGRIVVPVV